MEIPRRDVDLDFDPAVVPRDWCANDAYMTTFLNALSMLFPEGERFFVESVKPYRELITDPELRREVVGFIGQEAMHGKEHRVFNELLVAHGYTQAPHVERRLRRLLIGARKVFAPRSQLAITCAVEHFTAMLAEQLLRDPRLRDEIHRDVRPLWIWHALESEHKAVAFDVYRTAGGGYVRRCSIMLLITAAFFIVQWRTQASLMRTRGILWKPWRWARGLGRLYIWPGFFVRLVPAYLAYFRPGFHPNDRDTTNLLERWRDHLFGTTGELRDRTRVVA